MTILLTGAKDFVRRNLCSQLNNIKEGKARLVLYTTGVNSGVRIIVKAIKGTVLLDKTTQISP